MFSEIKYPGKVSPVRLDLYLQQGWRPMGQAIYTGHFSFFDDNRAHSTICIRLPLKGYTFRKSLRKLKNRNDREFSFRVRKAFIDQEKEQLNNISTNYFPFLFLSYIMHYTCICVLSLFLMKITK